MRSVLFVYLLGFLLVQNAFALDQGKKQAYPPDSIYQTLADLRANVDSAQHPIIYLNNYLHFAKLNLGNEPLLLAYAEKALEISENIENKHESFEIYGFLARYYSEIGDYARSTKYYLKGFEANKDFEKSNRGWFTLSFGATLYKLELYKEAEIQFTKALSYFNKRKEHYGKSVALNNIGLIKLRFKEADSSLFYFNKAQEIRLKYNNKPLLIAHCYLNKAQAYIELKQFDLAHQALSTAELLTRDKTDKDFSQEVYSIWSNLYYELDNYEKAITYAEKIIDKDTSTFKVFYNVLAYKHLALSQKALGQYSLAIENAKIGYSLAVKYNQNKLQLNFIEILVEVYRQQGDLEKALDFFEKVIILRKKAQLERTQVLKELFNAYGKNISNNYQLRELEERTVLQKTKIDSLTEIKFWTSFAGALVIVIIGLLLFLYFKTKNSKKQIVLFAKRALAVANGLSHVIFAVDEKNTLIFFNYAAKKHFEKHYGFTLKRNKNFSQLFKRKENREEWEQLFNKTKNEESWQSVVQKEFNNKQHHYLRSFTSLTDNKKFGGVAVFSTDFTDSYQRNIELSKKQQQLEKVLESRNKVLSLLAHDLKEGIVSGEELTTQLIKFSDDFSPKETKESLIFLNTNLLKTKNLLFKTLDWVRQQNDGLVVNAQQFNLQKLVADICLNLESLAQQKELRLINKLDDTIKLNTDPNLTRTVIRNLLVNSIKFSNPGDAPIEIFGHIEGDFFELHVKDFGIGLDSNTLNSILNQQRAVNTMGTNGEKGSGVGLRMCQEFLTLQGSSLSIISTKNSGSDFFFKLPLAQ